MTNLLHASATQIDLRPWNTAFAWADHEGPYRVVSEEQARDYDELGYFVLEDAFDAAAIAELDAVIEPFDPARQPPPKPSRWRRR